MIAASMLSCAPLRVRPAQQMLDSRHKLKIGDMGIVSYAVGTGQPRIALDVGADAIYFRNPFLARNPLRNGIAS